MNDNNSLDPSMTLDELANSCRITAETVFTEQQSVLSVEGVPFFSIGDLSGIKAKQKQGKTMSLAVMIATVLSGNLFHLSCLVDTPTVVYFDTEQKGPDTKLFYERVLKLSHKTPEEVVDQLHVYSLRGLDMQHKMSVIEHVMVSQKPTLTVIDGIVDLIENFNDLPSAKLLIDRLMLLSTTCNTALVTVLHQNKGLDDHNMRGHLGSILSQKAALVLECSKDEDGIFTVSSSDSRHEPVPEWRWMFNDMGDIIEADDAHDIIIQERQNQKKLTQQKKRDAEINKREQKALALIEGFTEGITRKELTLVLMNELKLGHSTISPLITRLIDKCKLEEREDHKLYYVDPLDETVCLLVYSQQQIGTCRVASE